ncbi:claudin-7-like [Petromyzon marinus]|uniref:claudin-7-like n=1 Tax=Petromyzon marinus TaxID=7757 RepID=UPI003F6E6FF5
MGSMGSEVLGLVLCLLGLVGLVVSTVCDEWKTTSRGAAVIVTTWIYQGLWKMCAGNAMGSVTCKRNFTLMGVPLHLKVCQGLMVLSLVMGHLGTVLALLGIKCSRFGGPNWRLKARIVASAGALYLITGLSSMVALSFYAHRITVDFYNPNLLGARFEYGWCLYMGWASSILCIIGAIIKCSSCYGVKDDTHNMALQQQPRYSTAPTEFMNADKASVYSALTHNTQQHQQQRKDSAFSIGGIAPDLRKVSYFSTATEVGVGPTGVVWNGGPGRRVSDAALLEVDRVVGPGDSSEEARRGSVMSYGRNAYV